MTTTDHDVRNDMYDGPAVELFETVKTTTRLMNEARVKQAEAVAALISAHVTPVDDFTDGMHAVFTWARPPESRHRGGEIIGFTLAHC